ncbi:MAG: DUF1018 domain-containing protein [Lachnospiraceae bacterium]|nr:DUF1018 domain-containing protein [Lachnospiraceae bacterium]MBR1567532.1 DUF1018 domain-containing protein [Lachnospiraceae bacterium]MBR1568688.1 DUF1018 domain-containing protein [Lachnospiraceae bacterium]
MRNITPAQMRRIWALARDNGMDTELLHLYVSRITEKESLKELTIMEAVKVIDALAGKPVETADHLSSRQEQYLIDLAKQLGMVDEDGNLDRKRLDGFCRSRYSVGSYTWLNRSQAGKVIEGLKAMVERKGHEYEESN